MITEPVRAETFTVLEENLAAFRNNVRDMGGRVMTSAPVLDAGRPAYIMTVVWK